METQNVITIADYIRSRTDEELSEIIDNFNSCIVLKSTESCEAMSDCKSCILEWLKQPYKSV